MSQISAAALEAYDRRVAKLREQARDKGGPVAEALEDYLAHHRAAILRELTVVLADRAPPLPMEDADLWTPARRTEANLAAMHLLATKAPAAMTTEDRLILARYSGFGGLSIEKIKDRIPASLALDTRELIHAYYTPTILVQEIARATLPLLPHLVGADKYVRAIEPSAGIGRFIRAFDNLSGRPMMRWTAVEYSALAASLLVAVRPGLTAFTGPFERWIREHRDSAASFNLVVSNPPFGERGQAQFEDPDSDYHEKNAASYFLRRGLDLLVPGGLGIYIIPKGFLSDPRQDGLRERVLVKHHLIAAFRLPTDIRQDDGRMRALFPGAHNVVDLLFFRRRSGELAEVDAADRSIVEGRYFDEIPGHVLGEQEGSGTRWLKIVGPSIRLPRILERPMCQDCRLRPVSTPPAAAVPDSGEDPRMTSARTLARRVDSYLAALSAGRSGEDPVLLWPELHGALTDWRQQFGNPYEPDNLRTLAADREVSTGMLRAFDPEGRLIPALQQAPVRVAAYRGPVGDPVALAEHLYRQERGLSIPRLMQALAEHAPSMSRDAALDLLYRVDWCVDGPGLQLLVPGVEYMTGDLWARYDHALAQPTHPRSSVQAQRLLAAIGPALLGDLGEYSAREGWIPLSLRAEFINKELGQDALPITLEIENGLIQPRGINYHDVDDQEGILNAEVIAFLGWLNHDMAVFKPKRQKGQTLLEAREETRDAWSEKFRRFIAENFAHEVALVEAFNRQIRGFRPPTYSEVELTIARWTKDPKKQLHDYQRAGVRRIIENRGGILSYDVGVGKTFTALAAIALLRQEGVIRRPVVLVPNSLVFQWFAEISAVLPDYRVAIIGSKFIVRTRGDRRGETDSATDTSIERAAKWTRFQGGEYDLVLLTYSSLPLTRLNLETAAEFIGESSGSGRAIALKHRSLAKKKREDRTERENAIIDEGTPAWIREFTEIPEGREYDGSIVWDDLGIDFLVIDELHNFKNLFMPEPRERGVPAFMGSGGEGSARAWQLFFRCAAIRARTGGAGILGLTATIAKNGPTELYTAISYINPRSWTQLGIGDSEQFIDQFCLLERRPVVSTSMKIEVRDAMVGFKNLADLRLILTRFVEFRGATELARLGKLKKPKASAELVWVAMNDAQRAKMLDIAQKTRDSIAQALGKEKDDDNKPNRPTLGMIVNIGLIAIHPHLVDGYTPDTAVDGGTVDGEVLPRPDYHSPKFDAVARRIVAQSGCGHIVFIEPIVAQIWLREVLVHAGIPRERIALLNAHMAPSAAQRAQIARDFNAGKYLVVIANAVAGEGANLQRHTCAVHNVDIPWDPMTRRQRNGRADRQGNEEEAIIIYDYLTRQTGDGPRFDKMSGKGTWIEKIVDSEDDVAINPAADVSLSPIELLADLTDDPEEARHLLAEITAEAERETRAKLLKRIARLMRAANDRYRTAELAKDPIEAARLRQLGQVMLEDLRKFDTSVWPFADLAQRIADEPVAVPDAAIPLWNGARVWGKGPAEVERAEFGRLDDSSTVIAMRTPGEARWQEVAVKKLPTREYTAAAFTGPWPEDDETMRAAIAREIEQLRSDKDWRPLGWMWASESWLTRWWPEIEPALREHLGRRYTREALLPAVTQEGDLYLAPAGNLAGTTILPPNAAGWDRYLQLAPITDYKPTELRAVARSWWDRSMPATRVQPIADEPTPAGRSLDEAQVIHEAQLRGLDVAGQEQRLEFVWRTRKYMEAAAILLRHGGHDVVFGPKLTDGFTIDPESTSSYKKSTTFAFGGPIREPASRHLAVLSVRATADVVAAVALEKPAHGDAAIDVVLTNLRADPAHYDAHQQPAAAPPTMGPAPSRAPPEPPSTASPSAALSAPGTAGALVIVATRHSKGNQPIWVAKKTRELSDQEFALLRELARDTGGYYSTYRSRTVPAGFVFKSSEAAHTFVGRFHALLDTSETSATTSAASTITPGSHYVIGEQLYGDEALLRALRAHFPATTQPGGLLQVSLPAGAVNFQQYTDDIRVPSQEGALYSVLRADPQVDLHATMGALWRDGFTVFRGTWATWDDTPGIKAERLKSETRAPTYFKEQATPLHHQDPESVKILDAMVGHLSESLSIEKIRSGQGYRVVVLRTKHSNTVFSGLPLDTPLVELTLWHPPGDAKPDWTELHAAIKRLGRPHDQSRAIRRHVLELVEEAGEAARKSLVRPEPVASTPAPGRFYRVGDLWYADTALVQGVGPQRHLGLGDFAAALPEGTLTFTRYTDEPRLPGQRGRLHRLSFAGRAILADVLARLAADGLAESGGTWDTWPPASVAAES